MTVVLAAWAAPIAGGLHDRFGPDVDLIVGLLKFPSRHPGWPQTSPAEIISPPAEDIELIAVEPLPSGRV